MFLKCESKKSPLWACGFLAFFYKRLRIFSNFYTHFIRSYLHQITNFYSIISNFNEVIPY